MFAVFFIGATYAPFNTTCSERINISKEFLVISLFTLIFVGELFHACSLSLPKIIFASHGTLDKVQRIKDESKFVKKVFVFGDEFIRKSYGSFNVFIRNALVPSKGRFECPPQNKLENVAVIFCSSGTTGIAKAIQLTQNNLWFALSFIIL